MIYDVVFLSRLQFAFTISFHIIFPAFTIGLASYLAVIEFRYLQTKDEIYRQIYKFLVKIFAVAFGMGVVSGVVMPYEFGTNWANFSKRTANVLGPLMSFEVLTAFFMEAFFLGIMLFAWERVSRKIHFAATVIVALGTVVSAFWIMAVNSWMLTPSGFLIDDNSVFHPRNWLEIIFNPSFVPRFLHMVIAAYITTAFAVLGMASYQLLQNNLNRAARIMFGMALGFIVIFAPLQIFVGDILGLNTFRNQPIKLAAMEGIWEDEKAAPLRLFGIPDEDEEKTKYAIEIPKLASLILTHDVNGEIKGLKSFDKELRPPVAPVFFSFRIMLAIGLAMFVVAFIGAVLFMRKKLFETRWFHKLCLWMAPSGFIALIAGWFVTEIGRQPYVVYGYMKTSEAASALAAGQVMFSLIGFIIVYITIFSAAVIYISRLIKRGPYV